MEGNYLQMVEECEEREERLTDWERTFIASMRDKLDAGITLYDTQVEKLEQIWNKVIAKG